MAAKQLITQALGVVAALLLVRWGWREMRRDWHEHRRLPLVTGPFVGGRTAVVVLALIAAVVVVVLAIARFELVPRDNPPVFVAMLGWLALAFVFAILGAVSLQVRRAAKGWIHVVGTDGLRVDADGASVVFRLRPGAVRLRFVDGAPSPQYVQLDLDDGAARAHVWGMVRIRDMKLVTEEARTRPEGLMAATSLGPLCRLLAPYLVGRE